MARTNFKIKEDGNLSHGNTPFIFESSRPLTTHGARSATSFNPSFDQTRNNIGLNMVRNQMAI
jgi:hypothetical protein